MSGSSINVDLSLICLFFLFDEQWNAPQALFKGVRGKSCLADARDVQGTFLAGGHGPDSSKAIGMYWHLPWVSSGSFFP